MVERNTFKPCDEETIQVQILTLAWVSMPQLG